ncbi:Uncharacterised protein [Capnocytophaga canimorsus]|nr:Uncharacterised protein [Capnocytophaga canimorsus]
MENELANTENGSASMENRLANTENGLASVLIHFLSMFL